MLDQRAGDILRVLARVDSHLGLCGTGHLDDEDRVVAQGCEGDVHVVLVVGEGTATSVPAAVAPAVATAGLVVEA